MSDVKQSKELLKRYSIARIPFIAVNTIERARTLNVLKEISEECLNDIQKERFKDSDGFYYIAWDKDQHKYVRTTFNFTLNQIEMWLCEYYKYVKYIDSDGHAKMRKYNDIKSPNELLY